MYKGVDGAFVLRKAAFHKCVFGPFCVHYATRRHDAGIGDGYRTHARRASAKAGFMLASRWLRVDEVI